MSDKKPSDYLREARITCDNYLDPDGVQHIIPPVLDEFINPDRYNDATPVVLKATQSVPAPRGLTLDEYQQFAAQTAVYPRVKMPVTVKLGNGKSQTVWLDLGVQYCVTGLTNEAGEVAGVAKKTLRDGYSPMQQIEKMKKELGDVLWYAAQLATELGLSLSEVAAANLSKLAKRQENGTLHGNRDER